MTNPIPYRNYLITPADGLWYVEGDFLATTAESFSGALDRIDKYIQSEEAKYRRASSQELIVASWNPARERNPSLRQMYHGGWEAHISAAYALKNCHGSSLGLLGASGAGPTPSEALREACAALAQRIDEAQTEALARPAPSPKGLESPSTKAQVDELSDLLGL